VRRIVVRHSVFIRLTHWINALAMSLLLMSGLQIFNAHPALYRGDTGYYTGPSVLEIGADPLADGTSTGWLRIGAHQWTTTGFLGVSLRDGEEHIQAFPGWLTIPSWRDLSAGRRWHLFFAWVLVINSLVYFIVGLATGHLRKLLPMRQELKPRHLFRTAWNHLRLRFPHGEQALQYNILQKLSYLAVIAVLAPLMVLTGWAMSLGLDSAAPWLPELFGGRQGARLVHFVTANLLTLFLVVHLLALAAVGVWNELRSMITGRYVLTDGD
jgi:thiosulfate reductase cytochrome b subunit